MNLYGVAFLIVLIGFVIVFIYDKVTGKKLIRIDVGKPIINALKMLAEAVAAATDSEYFDMVATVMKAAVDATTQAEELWLAGRLPKEERPRFAHDFVIAALEKAGIEMTQQIEDIVTGTIAIIAALLPHGLTPAELVEPEEELEAQTGDEPEVE